MVEDEGTGAAAETIPWGGCTCSVSTDPLHWLSWLPAETALQANLGRSTEVCDKICETMTQGGSGQEEE
jgi:hypothetical protein